MQISDILKHDNEPLITYMEETRLSEEQMMKYGYLLYHGIRFDDINRFESILQTRKILCGSKVKDSFISYDGTIKELHLSSYDYENCNRGKYVSVAYFEDDLEFYHFIRRNIFFAIKGSIKAYKTTYMPYEDFVELCKSKVEYKNLYSYAYNEYMVKDEISFDDILYIGIDPSCYARITDETISKVIELMKAYDIDIPFINVHTNEVLYCKNNNEEINNTLKRIMVL